jgi:hypothetical protein
MGSDSIDPDQIRLSVPATCLRFNPSVQFSLDALLEPVTAQHPRLVGRFAYFGKAGLRDAVLE